MHHPPLLFLLLLVSLSSVHSEPDRPHVTKTPLEEESNGELPVELLQGLDVFSLPLEDLKKNEQPKTTLGEQCRSFVRHYHYYCRSSNIAKYNEEVRIICERYEAYCSDRVLPAVNHIRRQLVLWRQSGLPKKGVKALERCYYRCKDTDPTCVNACECLHLQWVMDWQCSPAYVAAPNVPNCQRWQQKCHLVWQPIVNFEPADYRETAPPPLVRGVFYGYDSLATHRTFDKPRDHGVSFWRGTQTSLVNWPEGKLSHASTFEVPFIGLEGTWDNVNVGFPNMRAAMAQFTRDNPDPLNSGTGRLLASALASLKRQR